MKNFEQPLVVALVNNMPDAALKATERQFRGLLDEAAVKADVSFKYFFLPGIPRGSAGQLHLSQSYSPLESLWTSRVDGLIVTGAVPSGFAFEDEHYWRSFCQLVDWAEDLAIPSYWSCLAAHAAVRHRDGIDRRRSGIKISGIFECEKAADHRLVDGAPASWAVPHSRYNSLAEDDLASSGYRILSRLKSGGPDIFIKEGNSLAVFAQGHLEYDRHTILAEYRRDLGKFLSGESLVRPGIPEGYFDRETIDALQEWNRSATLAPGGMDMHAVSELLANARLADGWRPMAVNIFSNWMNIMLDGRTARRTSKLFTAVRTGQVPANDMQWRAE